MLLCLPKVAKIILGFRKYKKKKKKGIYRSIIRPTVMYGVATWCLAANNRNSLQVWERKVLRKIYGHVCENGECRIDKNTELMELYDKLYIVTEVKRMRLRWKECQMTGAQRSFIATNQKA
jgi:hypothetical protein